MPLPSRGGKGKTQDRLERLLAQRYESLAGKSLESGGEVAGPELRAVERLARLRALADVAQPKKPNRLFAVSALVLTLGVVSFLLFVHVPSTEIEVETTVATAGFQVSEDATLTSDWRLAAAGVAGFRTATLPPFGGQPAQTLASDTPVRLEALPDTKSPGSITLAPIHVREQNSVVLQPNPDGSYRLHLRAAQLPVTLNVLGKVRVSGVAQGDITADWPAPKAFHIESGDSALDIDLVFMKGAETDLLPLLPVDRLSLFSVEQFGDGALAKSRLVSSILSGTLYFESLNSQERKLRENEELKLGGVKGVLRTVHLMPGKMAVRYEGAVRSLTTGGEPHVRNLMPSWLEFLRAQRPVELLWISTMYLFGLFMAALKWLKP